MPKRGKVIVLVAPSGSGKSTIANRLLNDFDNLTFSVSATTRPPRDGETDGVHYHFIDRNQFNKKIEDGDFLEWEEFYNGKRYGTLKSAVEDKLNSGYFCLLDIEVDGAINVKNLYGDECLTVFIKPPSLEVLEHRLRKRGTEDEQTLTERLARAGREIRYQDKFDVCVVNDDFETAYRQVSTMIEQFISTN